jgi:hypothetical protein
MGKQQHKRQSLLPSHLTLCTVDRSQIWPAKDAPQYRAGFGVVTAMIAVGGATTLAIARIYGRARISTTPGSQDTCSAENMALGPLHR